MGWVILSGENPSIILARAQVPLLSPDQPWQEGWTMDNDVGRKCSYLFKIAIVTMVESLMCLDSTAIFRELLRAAYLPL